MDRRLGTFRDDCIEFQRCSIYGKRFEQYQSGEGGNEEELRMPQPVMYPVELKMQASVE